MKQKKNAAHTNVNRRDFLRRGGSVASMMAMASALPVTAEEIKPPQDTPAPDAEEKPVGPPVNMAVVGCGVWGRTILNTLARLPNAPIVAICDKYEPFLRRASEAAPKAEKVTDYQQLLQNKDVQAVVIATPSHQHRQIAVDALKAGKHVYCEAPLANSIEDARAIAQAAKGAYKQNFQAGLQMRSDPQRHFLLSFIRSGAMGRNLLARAQWHKKESWRKSAPNAEREREVNWRLQKERSLGLIGEIGIHQMDVINWFMNAKPAAITGFGGILHYTSDGRTVEDTVQVVVEYPSGALFTYDATLGNSFDAEYEMLYGTDSAIMTRGNRAWMFKEVDSPLLGWEVYARKDQFHQETGIALVANATKIAAQGEKPLEEAPYTNTPLYYALENFVFNTGLMAGAVQDFVESFGDNEKELRAHLATLAKSRTPAAGFKEGFETAVMAIKANEAITTKSRVKFESEWFQI